MDITAAWTSGVSQTPFDKGVAAYEGWFRNLRRVQWKGS